MAFWLFVERRIGGREVGSREKGQGRRGRGRVRHRGSLGFVVYFGVLRFRCERMVIMIFGFSSLLKIVV